MPQRIQRQRVKGWRAPHGAVYVGRPTKWGNPATIIEAIECGFAWDFDNSHEAVVAVYRAWLGGEFGDVLTDGIHRYDRRVVLADIHALRGLDLMCWCPPDRPCHTDVLLELANTTPGPGRG